LDCTSLTNITVDTQNASYSSVNGVLFDKNQTMLVQYPGGLTGGYTIPRSVINIGSYAFAFCTSLTRVTISDSVIEIGVSAFSRCISLTSVTIGDSVNSIGNYAFVACTSLTSLMIPNSVTSIGYDAFDGCSKLSSVTIGNGINSIGSYAFSYCANLRGVYFQGDAPSAGSSPFSNDSNAKVYYLLGATNWGTWFGGVPAILWNPQVQTIGASFGVQHNRYGFTITGSSNLVIVVEACTNLAASVWSPVGTNTLTGGSSSFRDPQWTNYPARFYRLRSP
jgi:hypothetical protein